MEDWLYKFLKFNDLARTASSTFSYLTRMSCLRFSGSH
jgi:hypothetical protein